MSPTHPTAARRLEERGRALFTFWAAGGDAARLVLLDRLVQLSVYTDWPDEQAVREGR